MGLLTLLTLFSMLRDGSTIAKVLMDKGRPFGLRTVLTFTPLVTEGWTDMVHVGLYDHLLVVNIGDRPSGWESSGRLVILDIHTLRQYYIPASTDDVVSTFGRPFQV